MITIILIFIFLLLLPYPIVGFYLIKAFLKKDHRKGYKLSVLLILMVLVPGFYFQILPGSNFIWGPIEKAKERKYNYELTGLEFNQGDLVYKYESERYFNGDGHSIWIHKIDNKAAEYFKKPNSEFFTKYPNSNFRDTWETECWKQTPSTEKDQKFISFASISIDDLDFELKDLLNEKGNYYSYEFYMHHSENSFSNIGNIDFYIICPKRMLFIKINHNT